MTNLPDAGCAADAAAAAAAEIWRPVLATAESVERRRRATSKCVRHPRAEVGCALPQNRCLAATAAAARAAAAASRFAAAATAVAGMHAGLPQVAGPAAAGTAM